MDPPKVLVIGYVWPEPESSAAGFRQWNIVDSCRAVHWELHYASPSRENDNVEKLRNLGISAYSVRPNDPQFDSLLQECRPDYVIFDRFVIEEQFGWRVRETCPNAVCILDTQDLHFLRRSREKALKAGKSITEISRCDFIFSQEDLLRELGSIYRSDLTLILSTFEQQLLVDRFKIPPELLFLSRFHYPDPPQPPGFDQRENFMMIGNFRHPPNRDGILWFFRDVWPLIRAQLGTTKVEIYGAYPPKDMVELTRKDLGFFVKGPIPDQFEMLRKYRVNLAPLRFGAGIKGKITDGWWSGTPVVSTSIGAEGMHDSLAWGGAIADTAEEFAKMAVSLHQDKVRWEIAQQNGLALVRQIYSANTESKRLIQHLLNVRSELRARRESNIVGAILGHHQHRSTKYFSKWIEAKNSIPVVDKVIEP